MSVFAEDVLAELQRDAEASQDIRDVSIDIGLTKEPYYTDKSVAIEQEAPEAYAQRPRHVHLVGFDTLIRFCNPKYYPKHDPPLSALRPFFGAGHKLRVTQRPESADDASSKEFGTQDDQEQYVDNMKQGGMWEVGFESGWRDSIDLVESTGAGVSSTRVRNAAKEGDWEEVGKLCTEGVTAWIQDQKLYSEDASGKKMMG